MRAYAVHLPRGDISIFSFHLERPDNPLETLVFTDTGGGVDLSEPPPHVTLNYFIQIDIDIKKTNILVIN